MAIMAVLLAFVAFAPAVAADTEVVPRESYTTAGFDAYGSDCDARTCTDTSIFVDQQTTSSGETFTFVCADQFTYNLRTGRGTSIGGCTESAGNLTIADDLSSATLGPTEIIVCSRTCDTVTVSANLEASGDSATFRSRFTERDGTCTFTYSESGSRQQASGTITFDGATVATVEGSIRASNVTVTTKCR